MIKTFRFNDPDEVVSNTYIVGDKDKGCYIIDLGRFDDRMRKYINEFHGGIIHAVLLTHAHFDHISGLNDLFKEYHPVLFVNEEEEEFLESTRLNCSSQTRNPFIVEYDNKILIEDEDEIDFKDGYVFKVIGCQGHTKGSVSYYLKRENVLFSGDTLFKNGYGRCDLPTGSIRGMRESLTKLAKSLNDDCIVYPGHGEQTTIGKEFKNIKDYL